MNKFLRVFRGSIPIENIVYIKHSFSDGGYYEVCLGDADDNLVYQQDKQEYSYKDVHKFFRKHKRFTWLDFFTARKFVYFGDYMINSKKILRIENDYDSGEFDIHLDTLDRFYFTVYKGQMAYDDVSRYYWGTR